MAHVSLATFSAVLLIAVSGCVVPVGPTWSNPESNSPPTIALATPPQGEPLGHTSDGGASAQIEVEVVLADQNTADNLYLRWIIDYPPYAADKTVVAHETAKPGDGSLVRTSELFSPDCASIRWRSSSEHRLLLAVSDRPFASDVNSEVPDAVDDGHYRIEASWPFTLTCQ